MRQTSLPSRHRDKLGMAHISGWGPRRGEKSGAQWAQMVGLCWEPAEQRWKKETTLCTFKKETAVGWLVGVGTVRPPLGSQGS